MTAGITCPPDRVEPTHEMSSCVGERLSASHWLKSSSASSRPPIGKQHVDQEQSEEHHRRHEQRIAGEERDDEHAHRVLGAEPPGEPVGKPVRARLEHRRNGPPRSSIVVVASLEVRTRDGYSLRLGVHGVVFTRRTPG